MKTTPIQVDNSVQTGACEYNQFVDGFEVFQERVVLQDHKDQYFMQRCAGTQRLWYMQQFQIILVKALLFSPLYLKEIIKLNQRRKKKPKKEYEIPVCSYGTLPSFQLTKILDFPNSSLHLHTLC